MMGIKWMKRAINYFLVKKVYKMICYICNNNFDYLPETTITIEGENKEKKLNICEDCILGIVQSGLTKKIIFDEE